MASILRGKVPVGSKLLVAVSGGPDSVALLHLLRQLPYALVMGHVDHRLRKTSARDATFVARLGKMWQIPCKVKRVNVQTLAKRLGMSIEEAAREARYQALAGMAAQARCKFIVTGHTADDQSETVLMNFLRGAGHAGLSGIPPVRALSSKTKLTLLRPMLQYGRQDVMAYLRVHRLSYKEDPTNALTTFTRNRIRHEVFPYLNKLFPGVRGRLSQVSDVFRQEEDFWDAEVDRILGKMRRKSGQRFSVVLPQLFGYHKALVRRILRHLLPGSSFQDIEQVLRLAQSKNAAGQLELSSPWRVSRSGKNLVVRKRI